MNAIILAAGLGTRMQPITNFIPKPLLPIVYRPMIEINIQHLMHSGVNGIGVNLFHKAERIKKFLNKFSDSLYTVVEDKLLGTGGALLNFTKFIEDDFIVHNCDVLSNINLIGAIEFHRHNRSVATLLLTKNPGTNFIKINKDLRVTAVSKKDKGNQYTFTGIAILSKKIFSYFPNKAFFSIIDTYQRLIDEDESIMGLPTKESWYDIGSHHSYWKLHRDIFHEKTKFDEVNIHSSIHIHSTSIVKSKNLTGFVSVGPDCFISENVSLNNTIVFENSRIEEGTYTNCLLSNKFCITVQ